MRPLLLLALAAAAAAETTDLDQQPVSAKAKELREKAEALWKGVQPVWELLRAKKPVPEADALAAFPVAEEVVELFERSLREEWNGPANRTLADAVRTWCRLRPQLPPPPEDKKAAVARKQDVREFVMKYAAERRSTSLLRACPRCDGRGESASPFGDRRDCPACQKRGRLVDREGVLAARWFRHSPLYRATSRREQEMNRLLRSTAPDAQRDVFAPYMRSVTIKEVEDREFWARVKAQDQVQATLTTQKTEKVDTTYVLFRVGRIWYLFDEQADKELFDPKVLEEMAPPEAPPPPR